MLFRASCPWSVAVSLILLAAAVPSARAGGYLWLGAEFAGEGNVYRFNLQTRSIDKVISPVPPANEHWNNIATDGMHVYLGTPTSAVLHKHDAYSGNSITPGAHPVNPAGHKEDGAFANGSLWRITFSGSTLHRTTTAGVIETTFTANPTGLVGIEFVGGTLFAANYSGGTFGRLVRTGPTTFTYTPMAWKGTPPSGSLSALAWDKQADSLYLTTSASLLYTITVENDSARAQLSANLVAAGYPVGGLADGMGWVGPEQPTGITPSDTDLPMLQLGEPAPNPARDGVWFDVIPARTLPVDIGIYDSSGRRMRAWTIPALSAGRSRFMWDFRDGRGMRAPAGVYFVRVRSGGRTLSRQFTHVE